MFGFLITSVPIIGRTSARLPPHSHSADSLRAREAGNHTRLYDDPGHNSWCG